MRIPKITTVKEQIFWSYACLGRAHAAVSRGHRDYEKIDAIIRTRLYRGLMAGTMNIRSIVYDEKEKIRMGQVCNYCGAEEHLAMEHIFPKKRGGQDDAENLILSCRSCNSRKGAKDLMEWMYQQEKFLPLTVMRRYMKLVYTYCVEHDLLEKPLKEVAKMELPFKIELLPLKFPPPRKLTFTAPVSTIPETEK